MEMSKVMECEISECAYNMDNRCHTLAITIGDSMSPQCDTFCQSSAKGGNASCNAGVGACKVSGCINNFNLECSASGVTIGYKDQEADCLTFQIR